MLGEEATGEFEAVHVVEVEVDSAPPSIEELLHPFTSIAESKYAIFLI